LSVSFDRDRLTSLFPALDWDAPTVVRCTEEVRGEGRYVQAAGPTLGHLAVLGHVSVLCAPAFAVSVTFEHQWPDEVPPEQRAAFDEALLSGMMEGLTSEEYPAWLCALRTADVSYVPEQTTAETVKSAAALAVQDALRRPGWKLQTWPPGAEPHGDEPA